MLDVALLRDHPETLRVSLERRGLDVDLDALVALDEERRRVRTEAEDMRAQQRRAGQEIAKLDGEEKQAAIDDVADLAERYREYTARADSLDQSFMEQWVPLPNVAADSAADGASEEDNVEIKRVGEPFDFHFEDLDHVELGEALGIIDVERAAKVSGSRFGFLKGDAVFLEMALVRWGLDHLSRHGFIPVAPPVLVRDTPLFGTGFFPNAREQVYAVGLGHEDGSIEGDDLYLVGTSEVALAAMHADEILDEEELPLRYVGFSTCFRREAGTYGKDTRGIFRVHQFDKLEMFTFTTPEASEAEHDLLLAREEEIYRALEIPYRVVNVAVGDLGDSAAKKYDIEAWFPGQGAYREITSTSNTTDYQARRLRIRYRSPEGTRLVHTLNGTAIAVQRTLAALIENHQQADGTVRVPEALQSYFGKDVIGA